MCAAQWSLISATEWTTQRSIACESKTVVSTLKKKNSFLTKLTKSIFKTFLSHGFSTYFDWFRLVRNESISGKDQNKWTSTLAGVAQFVRHPPMNQKVASLIPGLGTCLACRFSPLGHVGKATDMSLSRSRQCFLPSLSLSCPLPLK